MTSHHAMVRVAAVLLVALTLIGTAAAATIRGTARNDRINAVNGVRQTVICGRGVDVVNVDLTDVVRADCETVARRIARDTTRVSGAQHASIAEPDSFSFGSTVVATFQVGRFEDGGAGRIGWASSLDAGRTWRSGLLPGVGRASDPSVAYDATHRVWLAVTLGITGGVEPTSIDVNRSVDGRRWGPRLRALVEDEEAFDKEWIACDNGSTSPRRGTCYIVYTDISTPGAEHIAATASTDGGLTWSTPVPIGAPGPVVGAQPVSLPDGTLVVMWVRGNLAVAARSLDGSRTFGPTVTIAEIEFAGTRGLRAPALPSLELARNGRAVLAWPDCRFRADCSGNDIVISSSTDGLAWTPATAITNGGGSYLIPGIAADSRTDGLAAVALVELPNSDRLGAVLLVARNGVDWAAPRRLDAVSMDVEWLPRAGGGFLGDYLSASWAGGRPMGIVPMTLAPNRTGLRQALYAGTLR
jgi:hypothetical protein